MLERLKSIYGKEKIIKTPTPAQIERVIFPDRQDFETLLQEYPPDVQVKAQKIEGLNRRRHSRKPR